MKKKYKPTLQESVQPNLIPMVDIMFLLLLFFILGADMSQREQADLVLPTADMVTEHEKVKNTEEGVATVNVQHRQDDATFNCPINARGGVCREKGHWVIVIRGQEYDSVSALEVLKYDAEQHMETDIDPLAGKRLSALKVVIRGDKSASYGDVQKIVELCGLAGVYKIEVSAAQPPKG